MSDSLVAAPSSTTSVKARKERRMGRPILFNAETALEQLANRAMRDVSQIGSHSILLEAAIKLLLKHELLKEFAHTVAEMESGQDSLDAFKTKFWSLTPAQRDLILSGEPPKAEIIEPPALAPSGEGEGKGST